ncbi:MAG: hypothetical protein AAF267_05910, partial [Deinococcota bacterium]
DGLGIKPKAFLQHYVNENSIAKEMGFDTISDITEARLKFLKEQDESYSYKIISNTVTENTVTN